MSEPIDSPHYATVTVGNGKIRFADVGRTWDERNHDLFAVQLPARPLLYGEWRPKFAKNGDDFDVEVVFFGLIDPRDAGLPLPARRIAVNRDERLVVEKLIQSLISSADARAQRWPFNSRRAKFMGRIDFLEDWIPASST